MATLYMLMGLPGAGKTTVGKRLERDCPALLLCPDVWMSRVIGDGYDAERRHAVKQLQLELAARVLRLGCDVVLEFGFFRRAERDEARNRTLPPDTFPVTREHLELCATWFERPQYEETYSLETDPRRG
jgi:predicted kinase